MSRHHLFRYFTEPSLGPVTHHRAANLAAGGKTNTTDFFIPDIRGGGLEIAFIA